MRQVDRTPLHHHSELLAVGFSHVQAEGVLRARPDEGEDRKKARSRVPIRPYRPPQLPEEGKPADGEAEGEVEGGGADGQDGNGQGQLVSSRSPPRTPGGRLSPVSAILGVCACPC